MRLRPTSIRSPLAVIALVALAGPAFAKGASVESIEDQKERLRKEIEALPPTPEWYSVHFQTTIFEQYHPAFDAAYSGRSSFSSGAENAVSLTSTVFGDLKLWRGAEIVFNPELSGGLGLSASAGIAAYPNGEVYRVGSPAPVAYVARLYLKQTIDLDGGLDGSRLADRRDAAPSGRKEGRVLVASGPNQLAGTVDRRRLTFYLGKLALPDLFDGNAYAHDAHTQFTSWGIWESAGWDYAADTRGYTWGLAAELTWDWFSVRAAVALLPRYANLREFEWDITKELSYQAEFEARWTLHGHRGTARVLGFLNNTRGGDYDEVLNDKSYMMDITADRKYGRIKYGFAASVDQEIVPGLLGVFLRLSANDGHTESWAFTEIDQSLAAGAVVDGRLWRRPDDGVGAALVVSGLSEPHRRYLAAGGYGFIIGDGKLNYAPELLCEFYYRLQVVGWLSFVGSYQPVVNPGYNQDRGPAHILGLRAHVAF